MEEEDKNKVWVDVEKHIKDCLIGFVNCRKENRDKFYERVDELFLLWDRINEQTFIKTVDEFGIVYKDFNERNYEMISGQIMKKYPEEWQND